jgi:hypothetical protein
MARLSFAFTCTFFALMCAGCTGSGQNTHRDPPAGPKPAMQPAPSTPIEEKKEELGGKTWDPQWDELVEQALPPDMLSSRAARAVSVYCPRFGEETEAQQREFWAYLFQALAGAEAGLNPTSDVRHTERVLAKTDSVTHRPIRQEGLMQVAYEDAQRYGCDFDWAHDRMLPAKSPERTILQPSRNLGCGIKIMDDQIVTKGEPLVTRHSYWSTLRPGTRSHRIFLKQMANVPAACGRRVGRVRRPRRR